jgi:hypothetical protein
MILLPFDNTGAAISNLVPNEIHAVILSPGAAIITEQGLFYRDSMVVVSLPSSTLLTLGVDYILIGYSASVNRLTGRPAYTGIKIINPTLSGNVALTYQAVGGPEGNSDALALQILQLLSVPPTDIDFFNTVNRPQQYPPVPNHPHSIMDLDGVTAVTTALQKVEDALTGRRAPVQSGMFLANKLNNLANIQATNVSDINTLKTQIANLNSVLGNLDSNTPYTVNPITRGADPSGVTASDTAFANSTVSNSFVLVSPGTYHLNSAVAGTNTTWLIEDGVFFTGAGGFSQHDKIVKFGALTNTWVDTAYSYTSGGSTIKPYAYLPEASAFNVLGSINQIGIFSGSQSAGAPDNPGTANIPYSGFFWNNNLGAEGGGDITLTTSIEAASGQPVIAVTSTVGVSVGQGVGGPGIQGNAKIIAIEPDVSITLSSDLTAIIPDGANIYAYLGETPDGWVYYGSAVRDPYVGGGLLVAELDIANMGNTVPIYPFAMISNGMTVGLALASGGELADHYNVGTASAALHINSNDGKPTPTSNFDKGIIFSNFAIAGTNGFDNGRGTAIAFGRNHAMEWYDNNNVVTSRISSSATSSAGVSHGAGIDFGTEVVDGVSRGAINIVDLSTNSTVAGFLTDGSFITSGNIVCEGITIPGAFNVNSSGVILDYAGVNAFNLNGAGATMNIGSHSVASNPAIAFYSSGNPTYDVLLAAAGGGPTTGQGWLYLLGNGLFSNQVVVQSATAPVAAAINITTNSNAASEQNVITVTDVTGLTNNLPVKGLGVPENTSILSIVQNVPAVDGTITLSRNLIVEMPSGTVVMAGGGLSIGSSTATAAAAGTSAALPATPENYLVFNLNGTDILIPYYLRP